VRLATWNVNSVKARLPRLLEWLAGAEPDVVGLQEIKTTAWQPPGAHLPCKGRHPAGLNSGDCFTYALAERTGYPVLCAGDDFAATDLQTMNRCRYRLTAVSVSVLTLPR